VGTKEDRRSRPERKRQKGVNRLKGKLKVLINQWREEEEERKRERDTEVGMGF